ncbi:DUF1566 domain-containing protein [Hydrogenophaga sp. RWCD_12]|uniref:DUF1566 domain-containing protein n=1 Tax=Hydrogenophaga sp. RWCD_12 TaxID=3391190 RepID=UPI003984B833
MTPFLRSSVAALWPTLLLGALLTACGGSRESSVDTRSSAAANAQNAPPAALNAQTLQAAEAQAKRTSADAAPLETLAEGQVAAWSDYASGKVARKAATVRLQVYRFFNTQTTAHFYTASETEKANVLATMPQFGYDGPAFSAASAFSPGLSPVYRFYNTQTGVHFYTISEAEKSSIQTNLPQFQLEGTAYHASQVAGAGLTPLYRFYMPAKGFHFYTASETEKNSIVANLSATYNYEGIGYYVLAADWKAEKLPHTGITAAQCVKAGSAVLVACSDTGATALNPQQDGHRVAINAMAYSTVANPAGGSFPITDCIKDSVTGLIWEGKTSDGGLRDELNRFTHQGGGAATDSSGYVTAVNGTALCGYTDWRMPTRTELLGLVKYGVVAAPMADATWFGTSGNAIFWASETVSEDSTKAWMVDMRSVGGYTPAGARSSIAAVRLVRGTPSAGTRFSYSSVAYGSDAANNVVNDSWTGLQWRRCEEGRVWDGTTCDGAATGFSHEQALAHATTQPGWRVPNVKETESLMELSRSSGARINATAFPGALAFYMWTSTPYVAGGDMAYAAAFNLGLVLVMDRVPNSLNLRLVRNP